MKKNLVNLIVTGLFCTAAQANPWTFTVGSATVNPDGGSDPLSVVETVAGLPAGSTEVAVNTNTTLGFTLGYQLDPQWSLELLAALPFDHDASVRGSAIDGLEIGSVKHLPPTLTAKYHFGNVEQGLSGFVGAGLNYTLFFDGEADDQLTGALQALGVADANDRVDLELDNSFGIALQAGLDYAFDEHWGLRANVWYLDIDSDAEVTLNDAVIEQTEVNVDPLVYYVAVSYRF